MLSSSASTEWKTDIFVFETIITTKLIIVEIGLEVTLIVVINMFTDVTN